MNWIFTLSFVLGLQRQSRLGGFGNLQNLGKGQIRHEDFPYAEKSSKNLPGHGQCGKVKVKKDDGIYREKVVRGSETYRGQHPWQASIRAKKHGKSAHWCGAVLISRYHLLTAAHCVIGRGIFNVNVNEFT